MAMKILRWYLVISLLCHLVALWLLQTPKYVAKNKLAEPIWIDIQKGKYEVVDIQPPAREDRPEEAQFLGLYDSLTKEQQVATTPFEAKRQGKKPADDESSSDLASLSRSMDPGSELLIPEDYYPDLRHGPHTYLNVLRFPDIQYFVRLKRVFKLTFNPLSPLREAYFHNRIARGKLETVLGLSIDAQGNLAELFVFRESGLETYDQEAIRTIRASSPFSTPPARLLDKEGLLRMSWTFTVYL